MEKDRTNTGQAAFGMTAEEIVSAADMLSGQTDKNHPTESGSYSDFVKTLHAGREAFANQKKTY
jgi:hypothetical protein